MGPRRLVRSTGIAMQRLLDYAPQYRLLYIETNRSGEVCQTHYIHCLQLHLGRSRKDKKRIEPFEELLFRHQLGLQSKAPTNHGANQ